ncbi:MAG: hypothetical protein V4539_12950 [Bacteroidota bacterium]
MIRFLFTKNYFCCFFFVLSGMLSVSANAQQVSFIHIQAEYDQPYEASWNGKNYASSSKGYLVIPQVPAGTHTLNIRIPGEPVTDHTFTVRVDDKPRGFTLRQEIDNSWSLFDMIDFSLVKGVLVEPAPIVKTVVPDPIFIPVKADKPGESPASKTAEPKKEPVTTNKEKPAIRPDGILKIFDKSSSSGIDQVYVIISGTRSDTIALFIPVLPENPPKTATNPSAYINESGPSANTQVLFTRPRNPLSVK